MMLIADCVLLELTKRTADEEKGKNSSVEGAPR